MGYPMTWRRLLNRSHFNEGDYESLPHEWLDYGTHTAWGLIERNATVDGLLGLMKTLESATQEQAERNSQRLKLFLGDLRRLERDTLDERYICLEIGRKIAVDPDVVAAVLKEWLAT